MGQADLFAGAIFINVAVPGFSLYTAVLILLAIACIFTVAGPIFPPFPSLPFQVRPESSSLAGGLSAVIWTDAVQVVIMIIGSFILMIMSWSSYPLPINLQCLPFARLCPRGRLQ